MDPISQVGSMDVTTGSQIYSVKKAREVAADTVLSLVNGAVAVSEQATQSINPSHLGQNVDVKA